MIHITKSLLSKEKLKLRGERVREGPRERDSEREGGRESERAREKGRGRERGERERPESLVDW